MANPLADDLDHILEHTEGLWEELRGNRIFLTGGTGFFGCWLLESFLWANERLHLGAAATVLTRDPASFRAKAAHLAENRAVTLPGGDVRSFAYPDGGFSHVIHAATDSAIVPSATEITSTIVEGTEHVLAFADHANCGKFLFTSSGAVYGMQPPEMSHMCEDSGGWPAPLHPSTPYGEAKRVAEAKCQAAQAADFETKIARCFAFVGPYMNLNVHFAIGNFLRDQMRGGPIIVKGDGRAVRSYLYASDLAIWLWTILFRGPSGRAYNVGSEDAISIGELARFIGSHVDPAVDVRIDGSPSSASGPRYVPSTERARGELALEQWVGLEEAVRKTRRWFVLTQPEGT
ncbi:NAD-dependent epimerase/dehydratase [Candidatus Koribacter versatilis Ellin345]|uniref:NAD-dependent epimerase/dehydratase n=1 Tax=Koribacter versatilis (strain Ellin345) TaxID=204669 RepID=Q1IMQ9_KORVE|nr:NAD(P)-dependent oxidoreductase [Candidatus Koribacter versatilis]ABF41841.1 NAD-dependent epimerase/dehydratase [Candidatus Koribacter versatilis Ellin345]